MKSTDSLLEDLQKTLKNFANKKCGNKFFSWLESSFQISICICNCYIIHNGHDYYTENKDWSKISWLLANLQYEVFNSLFSSVTFLVHLQLCITYLESQRVIRIDLNVIACFTFLRASITLKITKKIIIEDRKVLI